MLEGQSSCLVSRRLPPSSCEQEPSWVFMNFRVPPSGQQRRAPDSSVDGRSRRRVGDNDDDSQQSPDTNSLIPNLGRDMSINCLLRCSRSDYWALSSLNRSFQSLFRTGEIYKLRRRAGIAEHWVYFSCNVLEWEAFDPNHRSWMHLPRMPPSNCFMCSDKESLAVGTELLVFGMEFPTHIILRYSILTNSWSSGMMMNTPRSLFGSASLGEIAILAGGCDGSGTILSSAELYNSEERTWETLPSMNRPRKMCSGFFMDKKFYVVGGNTTNPEGGNNGNKNNNNSNNNNNNHNNNNNGSLLTCGEEFDLKTRTWRLIENMAPARRTATEPPSLLAVVNDELYAADYTGMELRKYNKRTNSWSTLGRLPESAVSMNGWGLAFRACGDRLIVVGGPRGLGGGTIELNSWVPTDSPPNWNLLASKPSGSFVYNCAVMSC